MDERMKFFKNEAAWKRWVKRERIDYAHTPHSFPCYGYETVASWGMQESQATYLYKDDLEKMLARVARESRL